MRDRESGLTLTRDHNPTLTRKGQGSPLPLCLAASVKGFPKGLAPLVGCGAKPREVMGAKPLCKPPFWAGFFAKQKPCQEINTRIYFAFFVAPSGVILSSILLDNRSLWGDTTTPIEGRWSLSVLPS